MAPQLDDHCNIRISVLYGVANPISLYVYGICALIYTWICHVCHVL